MYEGEASKGDVVRLHRVELLAHCFLHPAQVVMAEDRHLWCSRDTAGRHVKRPVAWLYIDDSWVGISF